MLVANHISTFDIPSFFASSLILSVLVDFSSVVTVFCDAKKPSLGLLNDACDSGERIGGGGDGEVSSCSVLRVLAVNMYGMMVSFTRDLRYT